MNVSDTVKIIELLADGCCPKTGERFPEDSAYQQPEVIRALFVALFALKSLENVKPGDRPTYVGKAWEDLEDRRLCEGFDGGKPVAELAKIHQRTRGAIRSRLKRLGKIQPGPRL